MFQYQFRFRYSSSSSSNQAIRSAVGSSASRRQTPRIASRCTRDQRNLFDVKCKIITTCGGAISCVGVPRTKFSTTNWLAKRNDNELSSERPDQPSWLRQGQLQQHACQVALVRAGRHYIHSGHFDSQLSAFVRETRHEKRETRNAAQVQQVIQTAKRKRIYRNTIAVSLVLTASLFSHLKYTNCWQL